MAKEITKDGKQIIVCDCGRVKGEIVEMDGQEWLSINDTLVTVLRGVCKCGEEFHWSISERSLAKLINRVKQC